MQIILSIRTVPRRIPPAQHKSPEAGVNVVRSGKNGIGLASGACQTEDPEKFAWGKHPEPNYNPSRRRGVGAATGFGGYS